MRRLVVAMLLAASSAPAQDGGLAQAEYAAPLPPEKWGIGKVVPDLAFTDLDGKAGRLSELLAKSKALVIVVRDVGCPVSQRYGTRTAELDQEYAARGASFLYVDTNQHDTVDECRAEAKKYGFSGRYAREGEGRFGWHLQVRTTTDVFVLDGERTLRYRGPIDDQIGRGVSKVAVTKRYLGDAIDAVLKGATVVEPALTAPGCLLEFTVEPPEEPAAEAGAKRSCCDDADGATAPASGGPVTWSSRIAALTRERCVRCHCKDGAAPFELVAPGDFAGAAKMIREAVTAGIMPPWFATAGCPPFANDISLRADEKRDLLQWLADGCPAGDAIATADPCVPKSGWQIGEPDLIVSTPKAIDIPATGVIEYITVEAPTKLDHDVWVSAIQILCENPRICHHVMAQAVYPDEGSADFVDVYASGREATVFPEGTAYRLRKGANIRFNLHYTTNGTAVKERTKIGFKFAHEPPKWRVAGRMVRRYEFAIPPGAENYEVVSEFRFRKPVVIRRVMPHMHLRGKAVRVEFIAPDGTVTTPLELAHWNPDWQFAYEFAKPIEIAAGTKVRCYHRYDNSKNNPFNPDPTVTVTEGEQIWNEMAGVVVEWVVPADRPIPKARDRNLPKRRQRPAGARNERGQRGADEDGDDEDGG